MDRLPTSFGKYFLTEKIATGGMAEIYLGKLIGPGGFEKQLIIKQIHPELSDQRPFVDMFVAEAKTLVSLGHGNIVPVYELGMVDDVYFIAMEYIDGPTLRELSTSLAGRGVVMAPPSAAYVCAELLKGLDYAHRKSVIHRDVSPRNVMLSREGEVKLVDFGIALHEGQVQRSKKPVGSYPYMSPEQVRGHALTPQSDLFSVGVLLWEMLSGTELFARPDPDDTLSAVTGAEIAPPSQISPNIPAKLDSICLRALARDRADRYATAAEFLASLNRYLYSLDELVTPQALARLVARYCPPVVKPRADTDAPGPRGETASMPGDRDPAHAGEEPAEGAGNGADHTRPHPARTTGRHGTVRLARVDQARSDPRPGDARDADDSEFKREPTRPLPGRGGARRDETAVGKNPSGRQFPRRASTVRTFAANAEIERVMSATPALPIDAITDQEDRDDAGAARDDAAPDRAAPDDLTRHRAATDDAATRRAAGDDLAGDDLATDDLPHAAAHVPPEATAPPPAGNRAPARSARRTHTTESGRHTGRMQRVETSLEDARPRGPARRIAVAVVALVIVAGIAFTLASRGGRAGRPTDAPTGAAIDAGVMDAIASAPVPAGDDAAVAAPPDDDDASPDAGRAALRKPPIRRADAAPVPKARPGVLKVGANPWGEVYLDGQKLGRAPGTWNVPPGKHRVEVVFPVPDREQRQTFTITIAPGKTESLGVIDFSGDL